MRIDRIQRTVRPTYSQHYGDNSIIPHKQDDTRQHHTPTNQCLQYSLPGGAQSIGLRVLNIKTAQIAVEGKL